MKVNIAGSKGWKFRQEWRPDFIRGVVIITLTALVYFCVHWRPAI